MLVSFLVSNGVAAVLSLMILLSVVGCACGLPLFFSVEGTACPGLNIDGMRLLRGTSTPAFAFSPLPAPPSEQEEDDGSAAAVVVVVVIAVGLLEKISAHVLPRVRGFDW